MAEKGTSYSSLLQNIKKGKIDPCYLFYGEELFLAEQLSDAIIFKIFNAEKDDFNLHIFYGKEATGESILNAAMSFPVMAEKKVVVLRDAEQLDKSGRDSLVPYFNNPLDSTCFIVVTSKPDFRQKLFSTLKEKASSIELKRLKENDVPAWIQSFLVGKNKTITPKAAMLLASRLDISLRELSSQMEKLITFIGIREEINDEDVEAVIGISRQYNVFELCRAIGQKNLPDAMTILENMLRYGEQPVGMIIMMVRQFIILWHICDMQAVKKSGKEIESFLTANFRVWPSMLNQEYYPQAKNFDVKQIHRCFRYLLEADTDLKSSSVHDDMIMQKLIFQLIRGGAL
jgi:DNA polymerase-3 subunit delta